MIFSELKFGVEAMEFIVCCRGPKCLFKLLRRITQKMSSQVAGPPWRRCDGRFPAFW